jgi:hypothetical protein
MGPGFRGEGPSHSLDVGQVMVAGGGMCHVLSSSLSSLHGLANGLRYCQSALVDLLSTMFLAGKWATVIGPGSFPEMWLPRRRIGNSDFMRLMVSLLKYVFNWAKQG